MEPLLCLKHCFECQALGGIEIGTSLLINLCSHGLERLISVRPSESRSWLLPRDGMEAGIAGK